ncbi:MAG: hypothetical protein SW019_17915 [Actinomycetota bacterium]|nr:hypothetical protein [Actinomycetota bacterium]
MNKAALFRGAIGGAGGAVLMAAWSILAMGLTGAGFWTPINLIAHTAFPSAPLDGTFSVAALVIGLVVHGAVAIGFGVVFAALMTPARGWLPTAATTAGSGLVYGLVLWLVMHFLVWSAADTVAASAFTPWIFAIGHLIYGLTLGVVVGPVRRTVGPAESRPQVS